MQTTICKSDALFSYYSKTARLYIHDIRTVFPPTGHGDFHKLNAKGSLQCIYTYVLCQRGVKTENIYGIQSRLILNTI